MHRTDVCAVDEADATIFDEPAAAIDMLSISHIIAVIRSLKDHGGAGPTTKQNTSSHM